MLSKKTKTLKSLTSNPWFQKIFTKKPFENIAKKGENAGNQHFLLFEQRFLLFRRQKYFSGIYFIICLQLGQVQNCIVCERV